MRLHTYMSIYRSVYLCVYQFACLFIYPSIYLSIDLLLVALITSHQITTDHLTVSGSLDGLPSSSWMVRANALVARLSWLAASSPATPLYLGSVQGVFLVTCGVLEMGHSRFLEHLLWV